MAQPYQGMHGAEEYLQRQRDYQTYGQKLRDMGYTQKRTHSDMTLGQAPWQKDGRDYEINDLANTHGFNLEYQGYGSRRQSPLQQPMARERNPKLIQWGQEGEFSSQNPNLIYMNDPRGVVTDAPTRMFDTHTGAITSSGGRGPGSTLNIGDEGYQAAIDRYNKFNPQGTALQSLAGLSGQTSGIASQLGEYGTQMSDMQSQFGTRGETLADMQSQFGTRGETISGMQKQLGGFGDQFSKINEGIGGLTTQYGDMQKLLNNFQGQTAAFSGGIHDQLGQMEGRIGQLEQQGQAGGFGGGFGSNNFNPVYSGGSNYTQSPGYGGNYMPLNFGSGLNMPNSGGYPSSAYYGGISPFMFGFY